MTLSRAASALLALLMLHLNLVLGDPSCRRVASRAQAPAAHEAHAAHDMPMSGGADHGSGDKSGTRAPCELLAQPLCCQALTTRPTVSGLSTAAVVARIRVPRTANAHTSEPTAPDTPPPKA